MNTRLTILFLFFVWIVGLGLAKADSIEVSGAVFGHWSTDTVFVAGNIDLRESKTLIIDPGVTVIFNGTYYFRVDGCLRAVGSMENPILFTRNDTLGFHVDTIADGGWKQIRVENINTSVDSILFRYCRFEYGKAVDQDSIHGYGGALCVRNTDRVSVAHCTFANNYAYYSGGAVYLENASVVMKNSGFTDNRCGQTQDDYGYGGGLCSDHSEAIIENNQFNLNSSTGIGGGLCIRFSDGPVAFNVFEDNYSALGGGLGMLHIDTCHYSISNNLVVNNGAYFFGAGISNGDCSPTYVNNTIINNHCIGGGGGFYCKDSVVPVLINNILYGNTEYGGESNQVYLWDITSQPDFYYNNIQGGTDGFSGTGASDFTGVYDHNIDFDPMFETNSFNLLQASPCVNAGKPDTMGMMIPAHDLADHHRVVGDTIDIGAYEYQASSGIELESTEDNPLSLVLFPNPVVDDLHFEFDLSDQELVSVVVTNMRGQTVEVILAETMYPGNHQFIWNASGLDTGVYVVLTQTSRGVMSRKFIKK